MLPRVSICLPNLNSYKYLTERLDSIIAQTFHDWELIVVDSYSDDGSWELIQQYADKEPRMRIFQAPREGIYPGFNACISHAEGEFIYIATSDDTMMPNCLAKMVAALDQHRDCDICQCALLYIDEESKPLPPDQQWHNSAICQYLGEWASMPHKRLAPHDGILHFAVNTVYTSVTQILVRKRIFNEIGGFKSTWGPMGDFEWGMRASLLYNTVYIPQTLATWRVHPDQATTNPFTSANLAKLLDMASCALSFAQQQQSQLRPLSFPDLALRYRLARLSIGLSEQQDLAKKWRYLWQYFMDEPGVVWTYWVSKKLPWGNHEISDPIYWIRSRIKELDIPLPGSLLLSDLEESDVILQR
jgi:glycosyltransferase involved in cell wall biosynthesis